MPTAYTRLTKTCTLCKERKPVEEFYVNKRNKDKRHSWCRVCTRQYAADQHNKKLAAAQAQPTSGTHAPDTPQPLGDQWWLTDPLISQIIPKSMRPKDGIAHHAASAPAPAALINATGPQPARAPTQPSTPKPLPKPNVVAWTANRPPQWVDAPPDEGWFTP